MLESLKRWIGGSRGGPDPRAMQAWARQRGLALKRVREDEGVVVEGAMHGTPWRMEWGPPQRAYILERELRLRMDLGLPHGLQMLVTSRELAEDLEQSAYALFTQDMQTRIDSGMPEEMRWLAMFPKTQLAAMKPLKARFAAVASVPETLSAWLEGELAQRLDAAARSWLVQDDPMVLMTLRGRLYLRIESLQPDEALLDGALSLFEVAAQRALVAAEGAAPGQWPNTSSTAWGNNLPSAYPDDAAEDTGGGVPPR
jgi:hypothetical protein